MNSKETNSENNSERSKSSEHLLDRISEQTTKVFAIRRELTKETDRGCALMAASFLDNELMLLIADKIIGGKKFKADLFEFNGPLGSFSSRIKMAFALGLISKEISEDLDLMRKVRNEFGHKYESITFESEPIKSWILGLKQTFYKKNEARPRAVFNNTVLGVLAHIHAAFLRDSGFKEKGHVHIPLDERESIKELAKKMIDDLFNDIDKTETNK